MIRIKCLIGTTCFLSDDCLLHAVFYEAPFQAVRFCRNADLVTFEGPGELVYMSSILFLLKQSFVF